MNPVALATPLNLNGATYALLFDFEAVARAEEIVDRPLLTGLRQRDLNTPTITLVRAMFFACLQANHPTVDYATVKSLVTRKNLSEIWTAVLSAWTAGLAEPDEEEEPEVVADPLTGQS
jgi:hypothetical protein